jgi:hypothetical protein
LSTIEAEFVAHRDVCRNAMVLRNILIYVGSLDCKIPVTLFEDNHACIEQINSVACNKKILCYTTTDMLVDTMTKSFIPKLLALLSYRRVAVLEVMERCI